MNNTLLSARKSILFVKNPAEFLPGANALLADLGEAVSSGQKEDAVKLAMDICLDLNSYLTNWVLKKHVAAGTLTEQEISAVSEKLLDFLSIHSKEALEETLKEIAAISKSNIKKMCDLTAEGTLATYLGHDYCTGVSHSLRRGACFVTSNPAKINAYRKERPELWASMLAEVKAENPNIGLERLISFMFLKVVAVSARQLYPIFEASGGKLGFVCIQTNPKRCEDTDSMIEEILFWQETFKKELGTETPNIVYKIPAVKASQEVARVIAAKGIRLCLTLDFSYAQHDCFGDILQKSPVDGFVVLMSGFLDDTVAKELEAQGVEGFKEISHHAGEAVIRKSYANLVQNHPKIHIMGAAIRGDWTIRNCFTSNTACPIYFTTVTDKILEFDGADRSFDPIINDEIPADLMEKLSLSKSFRQAYGTERLDMDNIHEYAPLLMVLNVFTKAYEELEEALR